MKRMNHREDTEQLTPEDRRWVEAVGDAFRPEPLEAQRASAFQRRLVERIERRRRVVRIAAPALALAAAVLVLWFSVAEPPAQANGGETLLYAFADPDGIAADLVEPDDYLPEDYRALASLLESDAEAP
jgi:hypothetical protein